MSGSRRLHQVVPPADHAGGAMPLLWARDITPTIDTNDFVQGLLIGQSLVLLYGPSGSGKTFLATDLVFHVAAALPWMGRRVDRGGVFYVSLEGWAGFRNRMAALLAEHRMEGADLPFVATSARLDLRSEADVAWLIEAALAAAELMGVPLYLIVIDTVNRAFGGGDENSSQHMSEFVLLMDYIRQRTKASVLLIHHSGKELSRGARGHSLLHAAVDTVIEVSVDESGVNRQARVVKQRELSGGAVFPFVLRTIELGDNRHGEAVTTCIVDGTNPADMRAPGRKLTGHRKRAREVLLNVLLDLGQIGHAGTPSGCLSVPEKMWRDRFYQSAAPGATSDAKKHAFMRASADLVADHFVGMAEGRVWIVDKEIERDILRDRPMSQPGQPDVPAGT